MNNDSVINFTARAIGVRLASIKILLCMVGGEVGANPEILGIFRTSKYIIALG